MSSWRLLTVPAAHNAPEHHGLLVHAAAEQRNKHATLPPHATADMAAEQLPHQTPLPLPVRPRGGGRNPELAVAAALPVSASHGTRQQSCYSSGFGRRGWPPTPSAAPRLSCFPQGAAGTGMIPTRRPPRGD